MYDYLKDYCYGEFGKDYLFNCFFPLEKKVIAQAEKELGYSFPSELKQFYQEIGYGDLSAPKNRPEDYDFYSKNTILHPLVVAAYRRGDLYSEEYGCGMMEDVYEDLEPGDLPVFEIGDSSSFMIMKPLSAHPNAVWYMGLEKIEDSFARFIYKLYHDDPAYYAKDWTDMA